MKRDGKVGVVFADDEHGAAVVTRLSATGANSTADIKQGDVLIGVHGALVATTGQALEALRNAPAAFEAVFIRPSLLIVGTAAASPLVKTAPSKGDISGTPMNVNCSRICRHRRNAAKRLL